MKRTTYVQRELELRRMLREALLPLERSWKNSDRDLAERLRAELETLMASKQKAGV